MNFKGDGRRGEGLSYYPHRSAARAFGLLTGLSAGSEAYESRLCSYNFEKWFIVYLFFVHSKVTLSCLSVEFRRSMGQFAGSLQLLTLNIFFLFFIYFPKLLWAQILVWFFLIWKLKFVMRLKIPLFSLFYKKIKYYLTVASFGMSLMKRPAACASICIYCIKALRLTYSEQ